MCPQIPALKLTILSARVGSQQEYGKIVHFDFSANTFNMVKKVNVGCWTCITPNVHHIGYIEEGAATYQTIVDGCHQ